MNNSVLSLDSVTKCFGAKTAVDDVTLEANAGERLALIGHNGAGKTTLMKMILGLTPASDGSITVLGDRPGSDHARKNVAFLPENIAFHRSMTGREVLTLLACLKSTAADQVDMLLERVGLADAANQRIRTYSKGMRQGRLVACAPLDTLRREAALPIRIRIDVQETERSRVAAALNGREINGQTVDLSVLMADKMKTLAQIASFGSSINDIEITPPNLEDLYTHYGIASVAPISTTDSADGSAS